LNTLYYFNEVSVCKYSLFVKKLISGQSDFIRSIVMQSITFGD